MHIIAHRLDRLPRNLGGLLRLLLGAFDGFGASWDRLMERNAARAEIDDDILWVSGEPDDPAGR